MEDLFVDAEEAVKDLAIKGVEVIIFFIYYKRKGVIG